MLLTKDKYIFLIVSFIFWFSNFVYVPMLSPYLDFMGGSYTFVGLVLGIYGLMQFLLRLPLGILSDLMRMRRPIIFFGMFTSALSCFAFALTDSLIWILISRALAGISASTWAVFTVLYASYFQNQQVHRAMGSISLVIVLAQFLGMSVSGFIVEVFGWKGPFWVGGVIGIIGMVLSIFVLDSKKVNSPAEPVKLKELMSVIREPMLIKVSLLSVIAHGIIFTTMFGFVPAYALSIGLNTNDVSFIIFAFMIPHAISTLLSGQWFVPKFGKWKTLQMAFAAIALFTCLTPLIETKVLLCVVQALNGFSLGLVFPLFLGMAIEHIPMSKRATAMGLYQALYALGMFTVPFFAGILNSWSGMAAGFYFSGVLSLTAALLITVWGKKVRETKVKIAREI